MRLFSLVQTLKDFSTNWVIRARLCKRQECNKCQARICWDSMSFCAWIEAYWMEEMAKMMQHRFSNILMAPYGLKFLQPTRKIHFRRPLWTISNKNCKLIIKHSLQHWKHAKAKCSRSYEYSEDPNWTGEWNPERKIRSGSDLLGKVKKGEFFIGSNEWCPSPSKWKN